VPYLLVRESGRPFSQFRAWIGRPVALDPEVRYEVRNIADPAIDNADAPAALDATAAWPARRTEIALGSLPTPGGVLSFVGTLTNVNAAGSNPQLARFTIEGLESLSVFVSSAGVVTAVRLVAWDPDLAPAVTNAAYIALSGSNSGALGMQSWQSYDSINPSQPYNRPILARGAILNVTFPVTTTPKVIFNVTGRLAPQ